MYLKEGKMEAKRRGGVAKQVMNQLVSAPTEAHESSKKK